MRSARISAPKPRLIAANSTSACMRCSAPKTVSDRLAGRRDQIRVIARSRHRKGYRGRGACAPRAVAQVRPRQGQWLRRGAALAFVRQAGLLTTAGPEQPRPARQPLVLISPAVSDGAIDDPRQLD